MQLKLYQVDAFTERTFGGNPAAVVPLEAWLPEATMQAIALENNLSETAFFVPRSRENPGGGFDLRWFTPLIEADLCGHATLGTAWVLFNRLGYDGEAVTFHTRSGPLTVARDGDRLVMDFPAQPPALIESAAGIGDVAGALGVEPQACSPRAPTPWQCWTARKPCAPFGRISAGSPRLDVPELIVTAPGAEVGDCDFVSRFFAPTGGIDEDPVTGSAHCILIPYWAERLGKTEMFARQVSARGGALWCALKGDRVSIAGYGAPYLRRNHHGLTAAAATDAGPGGAGRGLPPVALAAALVTLVFWGGTVVANRVAVESIDGMTAGALRSMLAGFVGLGIALSFPAPLSRNRAPPLPAGLFRLAQLRAVADGSQPRCRTRQRQPCRADHGAAAGHDRPGRRDRGPGETAPRLVARRSGCPGRHRPADPLHPAGRRPYPAADLADRRSGCLRRGLPVLGGLCQRRQAGAGSSAAGAPPSTASAPRCC